MQMHYASVYTNVKKVTSVSKKIVQKIVVQADHLNHNLIRIPCCMDTILHTVHMFYVT